MLNRIPARLIFPVALAVVFLGTGWGAAQDAPSQETERYQRVQKLGEGMFTAIQKGDWGAVIDKTYPTAVELLGGRESAIRQLAETMKMMEERGFKIENVKVLLPNKTVADADRLFIVIPTETEMSFPDGTIDSKSYLLAISGDEGKTWSFVDGAGIQNEAARNRILPNLPETLKLPEPVEPKFTPKDQSPVSSF